MSCIQAILVGDSPACTLLADLSKAFERVNPHWILELWRIKRAPRWLIAYTKFILFRRRVTHKVQGRLLPSRTILQGVDMGRLPLLLSDGSVVYVFEQNSWGSVCSGLY